MYRFLYEHKFSLLWEIYFPLSTFSFNFLSFIVAFWEFYYIDLKGGLCWVGFKEIWQFQKKNFGEHYFRFLHPIVRVIFLPKQSLTLTLLTCFLRHFTFFGAQTLFQPGCHPSLHLSLPSQCRKIKVCCMLPRKSSNFQIF